VQGYDDKGTQLFAEIDWNKGQLLRFDYYEDCQGENFDVDNARMIAENFVEKLGYSDMIVARVRENGGISDFSFVYGEDGVRCYPDEIRVKVCRSRGIVSGFDGSRYAKNHKERELPENTLNLAKAQAQLKSGVEVESSDLAIVQTARGERVAYEFLCSYQDERYFIYVDATTGEEISIVNVKNLG
jgi:spore germination protein